MEKIIVRIPTTEKGKKVRIVIAGKHSPASSHAPSPTGGVPEAETSQALITTLEGLPSCWSSPTPCITEKRTAKIPKMREIAVFSQKMISGAGGNRTLVQIRKNNTFYMFSE